MPDTLYIVVPCYNEKEVIGETASRLCAKLKKLMSEDIISQQSRILFVDDGSKDTTWEQITALHSEEAVFSGIKLSRNKGHQNALLAGLMAAKDKADVAISMDADLQDDINAVDGMLEKYYAGCQIVYGVRSDRGTDTAFKRMTAQGFYKVMAKLGVNIVYNHADYRLMSKQSLQDLENFKEVNLFLRGIVPLIGYKTGTVEYARGERFAGESKYPLKKMLAFAMDGVTSFSVKPIRFVTSCGAIIFCGSLLLSVYSILAAITPLPSIGWSVLLGSIWIIGGLQLLSLGIIGEYVGKIYSEVKHRPKYIVETILDR